MDSAETAIFFAVLFELQVWLCQKALYVVTSMEIHCLDVCEIENVLTKFKTKITGTHVSTLLNSDLSYVQTCFIAHEPN